MTIKVTPGIPKRPVTAMLNRLTGIPTPVYGAQRFKTASVKKPKMAETRNFFIGYRHFLSEISLYPMKQACGIEPNETPVIFSASADGPVP